MRLFSADKWKPSQHPKVGEFLRISTVTSHTSPATTRTSFPCAMPYLIMQTAQHVPCRPRMVVLHKISLDTGQFSESPLIETLEKETAIIAEHLGLDYHHPL
jgi:hypothetical protein